MAEPLRRLVGLLGFKVDKGPLEEFDDEFDRSKGLFDDVKDKAGGLMERLAHLNQAWELTSKVAGSAWGVLKSLTLEVSAAGNAISDTSQQIGVGTTTLQRLQFAAESTGSSADTMTKALLEQEKQMRETSLNGATPFGKALDELGVKLGDIQDMSPEERLGKLGERLARISDEGRRSALSLALFGGEGAKMLPTIIGGTDALRAMGDEGERLGYVMSEETIASAAALEDTFEGLGHTIQGIKNDIAAALMPTITELAGELAAWVSQNKELIAENVKGFIEGLIDAGKALAPIVKMAISAVGGLVDILGGADKAIGPVVAGLGAMKLALMAGLGPWGLLAGAAVAAGMAIVDWMTDAEESILSTERAAKRLNETLDLESDLKGKSTAELKGLMRDLEAQEKSLKTIQEDVRGLSPTRIKELEVERGKDRLEVQRRMAIVGGALGKQIKADVDVEAGKREKKQAEEKAEADKYNAEAEKVSNVEELRGLRRKGRKSQGDLDRIKELEGVLGPDGIARKGGGGKKSAEKTKTLDELIGVGGGGPSGILGASSVPGPGLQTINQRIDYHQENNFEFKLPAYAGRDAESMGRYMGRTAATELDEQNARAAAHFKGRTGKS